MSYKSINKLTTAVIVGALTARMDMVIPLFGFVIVIVVLDYITGMLAGRKRPGGLQSEIATNGIYKKAGLLCLFCLGFFFDVAIPFFIRAGLDMQLPWATPFGAMMSAWIVITEAISVTENISNMGVPIPTWIMELLKSTKRRLDKKGGSRAR